MITNSMHMSSSLTWNVSIRALLLRPRITCVHSFDLNSLGILLADRPADFCQSRPTRVCQSIGSVLSKNLINWATNICSWNCSLTWTRANICRSAVVTTDNLSSFFGTKKEWRWKIRLNKTDELKNLFPSIYTSSESRSLLAPTSSKWRSQFLESSLSLVAASKKSPLIYLLNKKKEEGKSPPVGSCARLIK